MEVEYKNIVGFPGYRVGSHGSVWSCWQKGWQSATLTENWKQLDGNIMQAGYVSYRLRKKHGEGKACYGHRLVLEAFDRLGLKGEHTRHLNGNKLDNRLENLSWGSPAENGGDRIKHGKSQRGEISPKSKLKNHQAKMVPELYRLGFSDVQLGQLFKVHSNSIRDLRKGRSWTSVTGIKPTRVRKLENANDTR